MTHPFCQRRLGEILLAKGHMTSAQLEDALAYGEGRIGDRLIEAGHITEAQLAEGLAEQFHMDYVDLDGFTVPAEHFDLVPARYAYQLNVIPYRKTGDTLYIVMHDPFDLTLPDKLERICDARIEFLLSTPTAIKSALQRSKGRAAVLRGMTEDFRPILIKEDEEGGEKIVNTENIDEASAPVVKLINSILAAAMQKRVSDIHIETFDRGINVKYRIDGVLYPATETLDKRHHAALTSRLKVMAELDIAEKRIPQDGRFKLRMNDREIDCRVSILPTVFGEDVVIRLLDKSSLGDGTRRISLEQLGMDPETLKRFRRAICEPYGMVLITGPTGSGKTTTLYAALSELNSGEEKIITIEEPVEYQLDGITQIPVNEKKNLTFARGLRSILRHDPDKIMVGEIRDTDTAQIAIQSALTGHLVFTTVHANNVFDVIGRFSHMGVDLYNFVSALNCVMAQRLIRTICPGCKQQHRMDVETLELSGLDPETHSERQWYQGVGCENCNGTGYRGRSAIAELLDLSPQIRDMIGARCPISELQQTALAEGLVTLRQAALAKALAGETTLKEINRVTFVE